MSTKAVFRLLLFVSLPLAAALVLMSRATIARADGLPQQAATPSPTLTLIPTSMPTATPTPNSPHDDANANCMMCHGNPNFHGVFPDNDSVSLTVNEEDFKESVHVDAGLTCVACHTNVSSYPHTNNSQISCFECHPSTGGGLETAYAAISVKLPYPDKRAMVLDINDKCRACHEDEYQSTDGSAHKKVFESGNANAPVCVDCHGGHRVIKPGTPRTTIVDICGSCHSSVETSYKVSVHGATLMQDPTNPDVPTCINCHGVHSVRGPRETTFRGDSIDICGKCHADKALMGKYGISTEVFDTYLNDYHGRTTSLFQEAGKPSSKATCYDCHGIHNIRRPTDSLSSVYPANLQHTCQQCHKDASIRFPEAWLSHNEISWQKTPILYAVQAVYSWLLIPGTIGAFIVYIALDARRRWLDKHHVATPYVEEEEEDDYDFEK